MRRSATSVPSPRAAARSGGAAPRTTASAPPARGARPSAPRRPTARPRRRGPRARLPARSARARERPPPAPPLARELTGPVSARLRGARELAAAEERAAAGEPVEMRLGLAERGLVSEPPGDRRGGAGGLPPGERGVAGGLDLLSPALGEGGG